MGEQDLSRRRMLTGVVAAGGAGALGGRGTTALFSDRETFTNNSIQASASTAGIVDLEVDVGQIDDANGIEYSINLPEGINNNPSYIWVQAKGCPTPTRNLESINVELRVECESQSSYVLTNGSLLNVVNELRESGGEQLLCSDTEDQQCFEPGDSVEMILEVTDVDEDSSGNIEFEFEFYGEQCRYNDGSESPFTELDRCDGGGTSTPGQAISWIAFCSSEGGLSIEIDVISSGDDDGDPTSVEWSTNKSVNYVLIKSGQNYTIYDYDEGGSTEGTATSGGDPNADFYGRVSGDAETGFEGTSGTTNTSENNSASANPCELAADIAGNGEFPDNGTSLKFEWEGTEFIEEE